ncbi:hypothetical protein K502DRAFT_367782 [Neoconidiobolus thromboides FSU 785]|nr:hypothetical protein K502DRAFT_367782 [Neoconidiobolus thromboides FSU 785]
METNYQVKSKRDIASSIEAQLIKLTNKFSSVRLDGLQQLFTILIQKKYKSDGKLVNLKSSEESIIKTELFNLLQKGINKESYDILLISCYFDHLVVGIKYQAFELVDSIKKVTSIIEVLITEDLEDKYELLEIMVHGIHNLLKVVVNNLTRVKPSSIQPLTSYLPPDWEEMLPYVRLLKAVKDDQKKKNLVFKMILDLFYTEFHVELTQENEHYFHCHLVCFIPLMNYLTKEEEFSMLLLSFLNLYFDSFQYNTSLPIPTSDYFQLLTITVANSIIQLPLMKLYLRSTLLDTLKKFVDKNKMLSDSEYYLKLIQFVAVQYLSLIVNSREDQAYFKQLNCLAGVRNGIQYITKQWEHLNQPLLFVTICYLLFSSNSTAEVKLLLPFVGFVLSQDYKLKLTYKLYGYYPTLKIYYKYKDNQIKQQCESILSILDKEKNRYNQLKIKNKLIINNNVLTMDNKFQSITYLVDGKINELLYYINYYSLEETFGAEINKDNNIALFCHLPFTFTGNIEKRKAWLSHLMTQHNIETEAMDLFGFVMVLVKEEKDEQYKEYLLIESMIQLVQSKDDLIISKVLKIAATFNKSEDNNRDAYLSTMGLKILYRSYLKHNKIFKYLRNSLLNYIKQYKQDYLLKKRTMSQIPNELETVVFDIIVDLSKEKPMQCSEAIFPDLLNLIKYQKINLSSLTKILTAINIMLEVDGIENIVELWKDYYYSIYKVGINNEYSIYLQLIQFLKLLIKKYDQSEEYEIILTEIVMEFIQPILFPANENISYSYEIYEPCLSLYSSFPIQFIKLILPENTSEFFDKINENNMDYPSWSILFCKLYEEEIKSMARTTFKGSSHNSHNNVNAQQVDYIKSIQQKFNGLKESVLKEQLHPGLKLINIIKTLNLNFCNLTSGRKTQSKQQLMDGLNTILVGEDIFLFNQWFQAYFNFFLTCSIEYSSTDNDGGNIIYDYDMLNTLFHELFDILVNSIKPILMSNSILALSGLICALHNLGKEGLALSYLKKIEEYLLKGNQNNMEVKLSQIIGLSQLIKYLKFQDYVAIKSILKLFKDWKDQTAVSDWIQYAVNYHYSIIYDALLCNLNSSREEKEEIVDLLLLIEEELNLDFDLLELLDDENNSKDNNNKFSIIKLAGYTSQIKIMLSKYSNDKLNNAADTIDLLAIVNLKHTMELIVDSIENDDDSVNNSYKMALLPYLAKFIPFFTEDKKVELEIDQKIIHYFELMINNEDINNKNSYYYNSNIRNQLLNYYYGIYLHNRVVVQCPSGTLIHYNKLINKDYQALLDKSESNCDSSYLRFMGLLGCDYFNENGSYYLLNKDNNIKHNIEKYSQRLTSINDNYQRNNLNLVKFNILSTTLLLHQIYNSAKVEYDYLFNQFILIEFNYNNYFTLSNNDNNRIIINEPADYSRFNINSYLRNALDLLITSSKNNKLNLSFILLNSFYQLNYPLPPYYWTDTLYVLYKKSNTNEHHLLLIIQFALKFVPYSNSLMSFLILILQQNTSALATYPTNIQELIMSQQYIGTLCKLVGYNANSSGTTNNNMGSFNTILTKIELDIKLFSKLVIQLLAYLMSLIENNNIQLVLLNLIQTLNNNLFAISEDHSIKYELIKIRQEISDLMKEVICKKQFQLEFNRKNTKLNLSLIHSTCVLADFNINDYVTRLSEEENVYYKLAYFNSFIKSNNKLDLFIQYLLDEFIMDFEDINDDKLNNNMKLIMLEDILTNTIYNSNIENQLNFLIKYFNIWLLNFNLDLDSIFNNLILLCFMILPHTAKDQFIAVNKNELILNNIPIQYQFYTFFKSLVSNNSHFKTSFKSRFSDLMAKVKSIVPNNQQRINTLNLIDVIIKQYILLLS